MAKKAEKGKVEAAIKELDKVRRQWLHMPGVTAVDVGYKIRNEKLSDEIALRLHVEAKRPPESIPTHERVNVSGKTPKKRGAFPVDVIEASYGPSVAVAPAFEVVAAQAVDRQGRVEPLVAGVSCGNPRITAGTIGAIVFDTEDGEPCILSNWHVLCGSRSCAAGEAILQPGSADNGSAADQVAELRRSRLDKHMDAAVARLDGQRQWSRDVLGLQPIAGIGAAALGMEVSKSGRTTGVTEGIIDGVSASLSIDYGDGVVQSFDDQIHIVPRPPWPGVDYEVSQGGDSGSVWIDDATGNAIGLHFAGEVSPSPQDENAIANPIGRVATELRFSFLPVFRKLRAGALDPRVVVDLCRRFPDLCGPRPIPWPRPPRPWPGPWPPGPDPGPWPWPGPGPGPGPGPFQAAGWGGAPGTCGGRPPDPRLLELLRVLGERY